jgi:uncharacterized membrane protein
MDVLALLIAVVTALFARKTAERLGVMTARVAQLEERLAAATAGATPPAAAAPTLIPETQPAPEAAPVRAPDLPTPVAPPVAPAAAAPDTPATPTPAASPASEARAGLEERLGTRWVVWVGGLTLALGGLFLVRYSIEQGLLGPGVRVLLGAAFALALLAAGEWTRRAPAPEVAPRVSIPAILTAAGTVVAFGTAFAAYALYDFLAPASAFLLLGLVALGTLATALLHGPALAGLGVAGAFVTPLLVSSGKPDYWALYVYLAVVTAAAFGLARLRLWRWLAVTTIVFALLWLVPCLGCGPSQLGPQAFHLIAGFGLAAALVVCGLLFGPAAEPGRIEPVSSAALAAYVLGAALVALVSGQTDGILTVFTLLVGATLLIAWRSTAAAAAVPVAAALVGLVFLDWTVTVSLDTLVLPGGPLAGIGPRADAASIAAHLVMAALFALMFGVAGVMAQLRAAEPPSGAAVPVLWAASGCATPLLLLVALYARIAHLDRSLPFALLALALAGIFAAVTEKLSQRPHRPGLPIAVALYATGTLAALALAATFALEKGWLTIALALMCAGTAWVSRQRPIPFLRWLAAIFAVLVTLRIGAEPRIVGRDIGTTPVFNWLLWGYGVPALSFWTAGVLLRRRGDDVPVRMVEAVAILFTVLLAFLEIRHALHPTDMFAQRSGLAEVALDVCVALAMAIGLERLRMRSGSVVHAIGAVVLAAMAAAGIVFGLFALQWPTLTGADVGGVIINLLLLGYALPALLTLLLAYAAAAGGRPSAYANALAALALLLMLAYVSLEVRRIHHGPVLTGPTTDAEQYSYSVAWLLFGVVLLAAGFLFGSQRARLASAAIIGLTVLKAFVIDMSVLTGVYRALSFMGLGLVLVTIGWLYQRIMLRQRAAKTEAGGA